HGTTPPTMPERGPPRQQFQSASSGQSTAIARNHCVAAPESSLTFLAVRRTEFHAGTPALFYSWTLDWCSTERDPRMLTSQQKVLRRFWYATVKLDDLQPGPKPFRLLGENIVLFLDDKGEPAALQDRCCHRTSKLSKGWNDKGLIVCGYHGWTYDRAGMLLKVPQMGPDQPLPRVAVRAYHCTGRYGYAWVCLDEPLAPIPDIAEEGAAGYRRIHQFHEVWHCAALRLMENSFDNAHFSFVHKGTFGP